MFHYDRTIIGYHGCDEKVAEDLLSGKARLEPSRNDYDWLGEGICFWEYGLDRAWRFARDQQQRNKVTTLAVIGAVIQLGRCLDLLDTRFTTDLEDAFPVFKRGIEQTGGALPANKGTTPDRKLRHKDGQTKTGFAPPPHANRETHRLVMKRLAGMSNDEIFQVAVDAGIYAPNGDLTEAFGGTEPAHPEGDRPWTTPGSPRPAAPASATLSRDSGRHLCHDGQR